MWSQRGSQMSNCYKVHPDTNPGPFSHCGQEDISKRTEKVGQYWILWVCTKDLQYVWFFFVFIGNVKENLIIFSRVLEENDNHASFFKKLCENVSCPPQKKCVSYIILIFVIRGDHTTDIDPFSFGKKFDISISGKYAEQNEQVFTDVHLYYVMP